MERVGSESFRGSSRNKLGKLKGSKEWGMLNLLCIGQRGLFEANLQQFRKSQLSHSTQKRIRLCKLISHIIKIDGQYATILIEDISHMLNDANVAVQNEALLTFSKTVHHFMLNIFLAGHNYAENSVVKDAIADLACTRHLIRRFLVNLDACDIKKEGKYLNVPKLIHYGTKSAWANAFRVVMFELAFLAQLDINPHDAENTNTFSDGITPLQNDLEEWYGMIRSNEKLVATLSLWSEENVKLLKSFMAFATKSNRPESIIRSLLAAEVSCTLISYFPGYYFHHLIDPMITLFVHFHEVYSIYEVLVLRIFTSSISQRFHPVLVRYLNDAGYKCSLEEMYKKSHIFASCNATYADADWKLGTNECNVDIIATLKSTENLDGLVEYATAYDEHGVEDVGLRSIKAVRLFECDSAVIKQMTKMYELFNCAESRLRMHPPLSVDPLDVDVDFGDGETYTEVYEGIVIEPTKCTDIKTHYPLYLNLIVAQMMDTATSYIWHLRGSVVRVPGHDNFTSFRNFVFNKLLLSEIVSKSIRANLHKKFLDHIAQIVLLEKACDSPSSSSVLMQIFSDNFSVGVRKLLYCVTKEKSLCTLEVFLDHVNVMVMHKSNIEFARLIVNGLDGGIYGMLQGKSMKDTTDMTSYSDFVDIVVVSIYSSEVLDVAELRDAYIQLICKFILNLPYIPLTVVDRLRLWLQGSMSLYLSFSLVSNLLKKSRSLLLKERILQLFLEAITSTKEDIRALFLKLVTSPKGLYKKYGPRMYSNSRLELVHENIVSWIKNGGGCLKCGVSAYLAPEIVSDVMDLADRPVWQWPSELIDKITNSRKSENIVTCEGCEWLSYKEQLKMEPSDSDELDWGMLPGIWMEELLAMLVKPSSVNAHRFLVNIIENVRKCANENEFVEPIIVLCNRNHYLVPFVCSLGDDLSGKNAKNARNTCYSQTTELIKTFRYKTTKDDFLISLLADVRVLWWDHRYQLEEKWNQPNSPEKELVHVVFGLVNVCDAYIVELAPFLVPEQLEALVSILFTKDDEDGIKKVLELIIESPPSFKKNLKILNFSLPQHFMYYCYNLKSDGASLKRQTGLLDHCVDFCVSGKFTVEAALSACTWIVEGSEEISFVFGRLLCQLVQKVPLTRNVVIQTIIPALLQREAWRDKTLWRGVLICFTTLWPIHKEQLCRLLLLLPQEHGEAAIKTLQMRHNAIAFMATNLAQLDQSVHIPSYIRAMLSL